MSLVKKFYVYGLIVKNILTTQLMVDSAETLRRRQNVLNQDMKGSHWLPVRCEICETQPPSSMYNCNNFYLKFFLFLQGCVLKNMLTE